MENKSLVIVSDLAKELDTYAVTVDPDGKSHKRGRELATIFLAVFANCGYDPVSESFVCSAPSGWDGKKEMSAESLARHIWFSLSATFCSQYRTDLAGYEIMRSFLDFSSNEDTVEEYSLTDVTDSARRGEMELSSHDLAPEYPASHRLFIEKVKLRGCSSLTRYVNWFQGWIFRSDEPNPFYDRIIPPACLETADTDSSDTDSDGPSSDDTDSASADPLASLNDLKAKLLATLETINTLIDKK